MNQGAVAGKSLGWLIQIPTAMTKQTIASIASDT